MTNDKTCKINLHLFDDGGAAAATGSEGSAQQADGNPAVPARQQRKQSNPLADVKYGIQTESAPAQPSKTEPTAAQPTPAERAAEFERLIKTEYKDLYDAKVKAGIDSRFKKMNGLEDQLNSLNPVLTMLGEKYGVDPKDVKALSKAIEDDDSYYEQEALEKGVSVADLKEIKRIERENIELKRQMEEQDKKNNAAQLYARWMDESNALKQIYPSFDLETELQNPEFVNVLRVPNMAVRTAYEIIHKDEIIPAAMQFTAQKVQEKVVNNIIAQGNRPTENGVSSQSAAEVKTDPSKLTHKDLAEIRARVARGEVIKW